MSIVDTITKLIQPSIEGLGFILWGIEYTASGKYSTLKIYIDNEKGIMVHDCELISHQISSILDVEEPINNQYTLEVSSPGVQRLLFSRQHFQRFLGFDVRLKLFRKINGKRKLTGNIKQLEGNNLILATTLGEEVIDMALIDKANLMIDF